jgi:hypothetical protein
MAADVLADARTGKNGCHWFAGSLRQSVLGLRWLRGSERRRWTVPRSRNSMGGRHLAIAGSAGLSEPDGPLRDEVAGPAREPCRSC